MCISNSDVMFTFIYTSWEGIMNDASFFFDALTRLEIHFSCSSEGLSPYRGEWYHLQKYQGRCNQLTRYKEPFNYDIHSLYFVIFF